MHYDELERHSDAREKSGVLRYAFDSSPNWPQTDASDIQPILSRFRI